MDRSPFFSRFDARQVESYILSVGFEAIQGRRKRVIPEKGKAAERRRRESERSRRIAETQVDAVLRKAPGPIATRVQKTRVARGTVVLPKGWLKSAAIAEPL